MTKLQDENNNQEQPESDNDSSDEANVLTLYVRAGCDNRKYGACPFCQRIFMLLMLKSAQGGKIKKYAHLILRYLATTLW